MKRILREPLLHFLLLGAVLFGFYNALQPDPQSEPSEIVVSTEQIEQLSADFAQTRERRPSPTELDQLITQYVRDEILSREAVKLGLDQNDQVIRRRLREKMEFITQDLSVDAEPTENELADHLATHADDFRRGRRFSFQHVFLDTDKHGPRLEEDAAALLANLSEQGGQVDATDLGDEFPLAHEFQQEPQRRLSARFGQDFTLALGTVEKGVWTGPIGSVYGVHLVLLTDRTGGRLPPLDEVREEVRRALVAARREEANRLLYDQLRSSYAVTIEALPGVSSATRTASEAR